MSDNRALVRAAFRQIDAPEDVKPDELVQAIEALKAPGVPLKRAEASLSGTASVMIENELRPIGAAVDPRLSADQAKAWRKALLVKLSDLPGDITIMAVRRSQHTAFSFLGDVEKDVRLKVEEIRKERRTALLRLERWHRDLHRAQQPSLPAPEPEPVTQEEVGKLNALMAASGVATRWKLEDGEAVMTTPPSEERRGETA